MNEQQELQLLKRLESGNLSDKAELQILKALEEKPDDISDLLTATAFQGYKPGQSLEDIVKEKEEKDQDADFDYETGAGSGLRAMLSFGETQGDKEAILTKLVGKEGFTTDSKGRLALTEEGQRKRGMDPIGKNLVIEDKGFSFGDVADLAGILPEAILGTAGAIAGGTAGSFIPGAGTIGGAALGGGGGSALGQSIEEGIESLLGIQTQTGKEVAKDVAIEGAIGAGGSVIGDLVVRAGRGILGLGKGALGKVTKPTDEIGSKKVAIGRRIIDKEGLPSFEAVGAPQFISYPQKVAETVAKSQARLEKNVNFSLNEKKRLIDEFGGGKSLEEAAENISNVANNKLDKIFSIQKSAQDATLKAIDDSIDILETSIKEGVDVNESALRSITSAFESFSEDSATAFRTIDELLAKVDGTFKIGGKDVVGGQLEVFDTTPLKNLIKDLEDQFGTTDVLKDQTKRIVAIVRNLGDQTSFYKLARARKSINDELFDFTAGPTTRNELQMFRQAMDDLIDAGELVPIKGMKKTSEPIFKEAIKKRKEAMDHYRTGLKKFEELEEFGLINNVRRAASEQGEKFSIDRFYDQIVKKNSPRRITAVLEAVKPDDAEGLRSMLARTFLDDALSKSRGEYGKFNGTIFRNQITRLDKQGNATAKALFGNNFDAVDRLSKAIAFNGLNKLDDDILKNIIKLSPSDNIVQTFKNLNQANIDATQAFKSKVLQKLRDPNSTGITAEEAVDLLSSPSITRSEIKAVKDFFGEGSDAFNDIKQRTMERILEPIDDTIFSDTSAARAFSEQVKRYQKNGIIKEILGEKGQKGLNELAEDLIFLNDFTKEGAIAAANISINPIKNFAKLTRFFFTSKFLANKENLTKYLDVQEALGKKTAESKSMALNTAINDEISRQGLSTTRKTTEQVIPRLGAGTDLGTDVDIDIPRPDPTSDMSLMDMFDLIQSPPPVAPTRTEPLGLIERIRKKAQEDSLRDRASKDPSVANTLLGGLGSAGLL